MTRLRDWALELLRKGRRGGGDAASEDALLAQLRQSRAFDADWYLQANPDVAAAGMDPAHHYLLHGAAEGRDPGPAFSTRGYLRHHPDATQGSLNPVLHYEARLRALLPLAPVPGALRVLVVDDEVPYPDLGAGLPRAHAILRVLHACGYAVTFYPLLALPRDEAAERAVLPDGVRVERAGLTGLAAYLGAQAGQFDAALVCRPHNLAAYLAARREAPEFHACTPLVYDAEAVSSLREALRKRLMEGGGTGRVQAATAAPETPVEDVPGLARELGMAAHAAVVLAVNQAEAAHFRLAGHGDVRVLGHAIAPAPTPTAFGARRGLLFVGRMIDVNSPNPDSLRWFVREVWPLLRELLREPPHVLPYELPYEECTLDVVGECDPALRATLEQAGLRVHGRVPDLTPLYAGARVFIAPTRFAAGIAHKVHEAAARGVPVVASELIAGQLGWRDGEELLAAGDGPAFARAVARLYLDEVLWERLRAAALRAVERDCDPRAFAAVLQGALRQVVELR